MKALVLIGMMMFGFSGSLFAWSDPCATIPDVKDNWILSINQDDASTRDGLLTTLRLMSTPGFTPTWITLTQNHPDKIIITFNFNSKAYQNILEAEHAKEATLEALAGIVGNSLQCDFIGAPGMGVRTLD